MLVIGEKKEVEELKEEITKLQEEIKEMKELLKKQITQKVPDEKKPELPEKEQEIIREQPVPVK
ncbi:MAG TPA: hypothetical protein ENN58_03010 [bacterium]|nr:hypothetical protein [bacterium]